MLAPLQPCRVTSGSSDVFLGGGSKTPRTTRCTHPPTHPQVIGEEALEQLAMVGEVPDLIVGCTGEGWLPGVACYNKSSGVALHAEQEGGGAPLRDQRTHWLSACTHFPLPFQAAAPTLRALRSPS